MICQHRAPDWSVSTRLKTPGPTCGRCGGDSRWDWCLVLASIKVIMVHSPQEMVTRLCLLSRSYNSLLIQRAGVPKLLEPCLNAPFVKDMPARKSQQRLVNLQQCIHPTAKTAIVMSGPSPPKSPCRWHRPPLCVPLQLACVQADERRLRRQSYTKTVSEPRATSLLQTGPQTRVAED